MAVSRCLQAALAGLTVFAVAIPPSSAQVIPDVPQSPPETAANDEPIVVEGERDPKDKVTCRMEIKTGSNLRRKVCKTARQAEEEARASREAMEQARERMAMEEFVRNKQRDGDP